MWDAYIEALENLKFQMRIISESNLPMPIPDFRPLYPSEPHNHDEKLISERVSAALRELGLFNRTLEELGETLREQGKGVG